MFDARLDALSVGRRLITSLSFEPTAVELAVFQPNIGYAPERPAIPFQFEVTPWKSDANLPGATPSTVLRAHASIANFLNPMMPMPTTSFAFMLALPPSEAEAIYYRDPVADWQEAVTEAPPAWLALEPMGHSHPAVQNEIARVFGLPLGTLFPTRGGVTFHVARHGSSPEPSREPLFGARKRDMDAFPRDRAWRWLGRSRPRKRNGRGFRSW